MKTSLAICLLTICTAHAQWVPIGQNTNTGATTIDAQLNALGTVPSNTTGNIAYLTHDGRITGTPTNATWKTIPIAFAPGAWTHVWAYSPTTNVVSSNNAPGIYWVTNPPAGAVAARVQCWGGAGGGGTSSQGGSGAYAEYYWTPTASSTIEVWSAQGGQISMQSTTGTNFTPRAYPGGGIGVVARTSGTIYGGSGGGWSGLKENGVMLCVAGGGGGNGNTVAWVGGSGGYPSGGIGIGSPANALGGSQVAGGAAGGTNGLPGTAFQGGDILNVVILSNGIGGGGGGYYGGGSGAQNGTGAGAGGGGSSYVADIAHGLALPAATSGTAPNSNDPNYSAGVALGTLTGHGGPGLVVLSFYVP